MEKKITIQYSSIAKYILYAILLFSPLARGSVHPWHHGVIQIGVLLMLSLLLMQTIQTKESLLPKTSLDKPILALLLLCCISFFFSVSRPDSVEAIALLLSYITIFYVTVYFCRTRRNQRELVYVICIIASLPVLIGFLKFMDMIPFSLWNYDDLHYPKTFLTGVFGNYNHLAGYLEMVIPLMLILFVTRTRRGWRKAALICWVLIFVICHILTLSRGGWISLGGALLFMTLILLSNKKFTSKKLLITLCSTASVLVFFVLSGSRLFERMMSLAEEEVVLGVNGRMRIWKGTLTLIKEHIFVGTGPGTFAIVFPRFQPPGTTARFYQAHQDYLQFISEIGVFFIPLLCWMLYALFRSGFKGLHSRSRQKWGVTLGAMTGIFAILIHSFVDFNLHIPANAILFTVLAAIVVSRQSTPAPNSNFTNGKQ